jgi:3-methyl-2-oxobutanoate hydroxymethyltransferase
VGLALNGNSPPRQKITVATLKEKKLRREPITCLTAYDYATARLLDEAAIDIVLVGDSLAMTMLGYENTLSVTVDEMLHHAKAVRRGVRNARFMKEANAEVVKIEGGEKRADTIRRVIDAEIPVCGHIGLTPQSVNRMGGYKVQGKSLPEIEQLMSDAIALDRAGVAAIVLEGIPREVAAMITAEVGVPTIGIGAGPDCDGQVLVIHDLLNLTFAPPAKFVRRYADLAAEITRAAETYRDDVLAHTYPSDAESYHLPEDTRRALESLLERKKTLRR